MTAKKHAVQDKRELYGDSKRLNATFENKQLGGSGPSGLSEKASSQVLEGSNLRNKASKSAASNPEKGNTQNNKPDEKVCIEIHIEEQRDSNVEDLICLNVGKNGADTSDRQRLYH